MRKAKKTTKPEAEIETDLGALPPPQAPKSPFRSIPKGWKPAGEALDYVRAVPTVFPDFNRATRVGGLPLRRITTVHGPTHGGKSAFIGGLIKSFVDAGHAAAYCDAEHATDLGFFDGIMGRPVREIPSFFGMRPDSYEETIDAIDDFLSSMIQERKARNAAPGSPDDLAGIIVVDSINKLVPDRELAKLKKEGADAIDKGWGRYRAAMNQAWLDHVVPLITKAETALVIIAQERDEDQVEAWETPTPKGGKAVQYDASLICRVSKSSPVRDGEGSDSTVYGFKHKVRIWKSKVGHMDGRWSDCFFHLSNGALTPAGLDVARDLIEVAKELEIITTAGSWVTYKKKRWQGTHRAVTALTSDPATAAEIMSDIQSRIVKDAT